MRGRSVTVTGEEGPRGTRVSTFAFQTSEGAEATVRHVVLDAHHQTAIGPSTIDEACTVILHLRATDHFELHGMAGPLWGGRCAPGSVSVVVRRDMLTLKTSQSMEALILGIPPLSVPRPAPGTQTYRKGNGAEAHDLRDAVAHGLGLAFLAALNSAADARSTVHLARAMCYHFIFKHAWAQGKFASAERCGLAPWQIRTATKLLGRDARQVCEAAAACRLSSSTFRRRFQVTFLRSPRAWKAEQRIVATQVLLRDADASLADAALQAGFSDQASMSRPFRRIVGASPGEWRRSQLKGQTS